MTFASHPGEGWVDMQDHEDRISYWTKYDRGWLVTILADYRIGVIRVLAYPSEEGRVDLDKWFHVGMAFDFSAGDERESQLMIDIMDLWDNHGPDLGAFERIKLKVEAGVGNGSKGYVL